TLDRFDGRAAVAERKGKSVRSDRPDEVHRKEVLVQAVVDTDEEHGTRTYIEDHQARESPPRQGEVSRPIPAPASASVQAAIPGSPERGGASVAPAPHLEAPEQCPACRPETYVSELEHRDGPLDTVVEEMQLRGRVCHGYAHGLIESDRDRQRIECGDHVIRRDIEGTARSDQEHA